MSINVLAPNCFSHLVVPTLLSIKNNLSQLYAGMGIGECQQWLIKLRSSIFEL